MKFQASIPVYGDKSYRGASPVEDVSQINFISWIRYNYPEIALTLIHPKGEGKRSFQQAAKEKKMGLTAGISDIIIPGNPCFVLEIKRENHTKSKWQKGQQEFLEQAKKQGSFACVGLGANGSKEAFLAWLDILASSK